MMTRQEIFNKAYIGLRDQGFVQSTVNKTFCAYRGAKNTKCAFGHLIPDDVYFDRIETRTSDYLLDPVCVSRYIEELQETIDSSCFDIGEKSILDTTLKKFQVFKNWADQTFDVNDVQFVQKLQDAHDLADNPGDMKQRLLAVAVENDLTVPE